MRPGWVIGRWLGLLALLFLGAWCGAHLARADPKPAPTVQVHPSPAPAAKRDNDVPTTPPGFPFGLPGGSATPANPGTTPQFGFRPHP